MMSPHALRRVGAALCVPLTAALLTACMAGGSGGSAAVPSTPTPTPTPVATFGPLPSTRLAAADAAALQKALDAARAIGYPDALATVITPRGTWSGASGVDGPRGRKAATGDVFSIASVTKTFTAALVFRLADQRRIDLDAPLSRYLDPAAARRANGATVRQALAMRAGIPDTPDAVREAALADPRRVSTVDEIVASMPSPTARPGGTADQSNPTYKLLALAAERAGGGTWEQLVRTELVQPASVPGTLVVQRAGTRTPGPWALPTEEGPWGTGGTLPFVADTSFSHGATDMAADTRSLAVWGWALFSGQIVSATALTAMASDDGTGIGSGLDPYSGTLPEGSLGHEGGKAGFHTLLVAVPSRQAVVVVAVNDEDAALDVIAGDLLAAIA